MTHYRKIICLVLTAALALAALTGCASGTAPTVATAETTQAAETTPIVAEAAPTEAVSEITAVEVSTVDELIAAIAPNTVITLAAGVYDLTTASTYPTVKDGETEPYDYYDVTAAAGDYCSWIGTFDGLALTVRDVENLTVTAKEGESAEIVTVPRYADVLAFESCRGICLENLTMGHSEGVGNCAGAVLNFTSCQDVAVGGCALYGCGTWGIQATDTRNLRAENTEIYECSQGAIQLNSCYNASAEDCSFHDCTGDYCGLITINQSQEVAVLNSTVENNSSVALAVCGIGCDGVYIGGVSLSMNSFAGLYSSQSAAIVFDQCYADGLPQELVYVDPYSSSESRVAAVNAQGAELKAADLSQGQAGRVSWTAKEQTVAQAPAAGEDGKVHVSTVEEFLAAIASDTTVYLEPGTYDLSQAETYGGMGTDAYSWAEEYDGATLTLRNVENLTIEGESPDTTQIVTQPRYADVLCLDGCEGTTLKGLSLGHTPEQGSCAGDVVEMRSSKDIRIEGCSLYGCGVNGVNASTVVGLTVEDTEIHNCEWYPADLFGCTDVAFNGCNFHDNGIDEIVRSSCLNVTVDGEELG